MAGVECESQALPFTEPATRLVYVRNRWYDPQTGTFLSPDPMGYTDSSNLYAFAGGDPVSGRDPLGLAASVNAKGDIVGIRPNGSHYFISAAEAQADPVMALRLLESDDDLGFDAQEEIMTMAGLPIPVSSACRVGENCLSDPRDVNPNAFTHLPKTGKWVEAAFIATTGLPPQNREQEITSGVARITKAVVPAAAGAYVYAKQPKAPSIEPRDAQYVYDVRTGRYRDTQTGRFTKQRDLPYPPNDGFVWSQDIVLQPGMIIDRFGRPTGRHAGDVGATISQRGLPPGSEHLRYTRYEVVRPIEVKAGPAVEVEPFGAVGGGTQYYFRKPISEYVREGVLREIK